MIPPERTPVPRVRPRPLRERAWWVDFTAPLLAFIASGPTRTWSEIVGWGTAHGLVDPQKAAKNSCHIISEAVAFLELDRQIEDVRAGDRAAEALWAVRSDDGSRECRHGRMSCDACEWSAGFPAGQKERTKVCA